MPQRKSIARHEYNGVLLAPGDSFEVTPEHVRLLLALGRIERESGDPVEPYVTVGQIHPSVSEVTIPQRRHRK